jgi:hypothetical protein
MLAGTSREPNTILPATTPSVPVSPALILAETTGWTVTLVPRDLTSFTNGCNAFEASVGETPGKIVRADIEFPVGSAEMVKYWPA